MNGGLDTSMDTWDESIPGYDDDLCYFHLRSLYFDGWMIFEEGNLG